MNGGMSLIVKSTVRWIFGFVLVFGASTVLYGHLTPGGGFAGGVIIACGFILWVLSYGGRGRLSFSHAVASKLDVVGLAAFEVLALAGFLGGVFFLNFVQRFWPGENFELYSGGVIPAMNLAVGLKVAAAITLVFLVLTAVRLPEDGSDADDLSTLEDAQ
ncbi:MAG TPA: cation:proton antiporter [Planctomycetes bacterium]|nr:cation:proton antiporter [Planctomycetota bacterium]